MRVELEQRSFTVSSGQPFELTVEVHNTGEVIDSYGVRVVGLDPSWVESDPEVLALFPTSSGEIRLEVRVPPSFDAGSHQLTLEVTSQIGAGERELVNIELNVLPRTDIGLELRPSVVTGRKRGEFTILATNDGNTPIELSLTGNDDQTVATLDFSPPFLDVPAGGTATGILRVRAKRPFFGSRISRSLTVRGLSEEAEPTAAGFFIQKPRIPGGMLTMLILVALIVGWAAVVLVGLGAVLDRDNQPKTVPASFYSSLPGQEGAAAPLDVQAVGGSLAGTVVSGITGDPVPRISVEAVRERRGVPTLAGAAATDDAGAFTIEGLLPATYKLRFTAEGYDEVWYPAAPSAAAAEKVKVSPTQETGGFEMKLTGRPGTISGRVDTGEGSSQRPVTVEARQIIDEEPGAIVATAPTDGSGNFSLPDLATPAVYELTFSASGFDAAKTTEDLAGGEQVTINTQRLATAKGSIAGTVTDGTNPLGGVKVTATADDDEFTTETPTAGRVGTFQLERLPTPRTYLLTFEIDGFGTESLAVNLDPGEALTGVAVDMTGGKGRVTGKVTSAAGTALGDVSVKLEGGSTSATTKTLTSGEIGTYDLRGVKTPGSYTVTFTADGFEKATRTVTLADGGSASGIDVTLQPSAASVTGTVRNATTSAGISGVQIEITDGGTPRTTSSATSPAGRYTIDGLSSGAYTLTFSKTGFKSKNVLVDLTAGEAETVDVSLTPS